MSELRRGQIVIATEGSGYAGKPRPCLILQADKYLGRIDSVTVARLTTTKTDAPMFRIPVNPSQRNGLTEPGYVRIDKLMTIEAARIAGVAGMLSDPVMRSVEDGLRRWLDL
jgi:mRNA interferase MazF